MFLLSFYDVYDVSLWEKKVNKCLCRIPFFYRSSHRRCSAKNVFLKILQYSQENICVAVSLQVFRFAILLIRNINTYISLRILQNTIKEHHFERHLRTTASYFMNKNRNNSNKKKLNGNLWVLNFVNSISPCSGRVRSAPAGRSDISPRQTVIM